MDITAPRLARWPATRGESFRKFAGSRDRTVTLEAIEARVEAVVDAAAITRVTDLTRLDTCEIPVFAAVTPLARDLTTHMGKGIDARAARVSAMMEAIERLSAEDVGGECRRASFADLRSAGVNAADPLWFDLPPATRYRSDAEFDWVDGWDLVTDQPIWILADLARSPARDGVLDQVDTNGLAAGATYGEAVRHALLEAIERDAVSQHQFFELYGDGGRPGPPSRRLDPHSLPERLRSLVDQAARNGMDLALDDITGDTGVPVLSCTLTDFIFPSVHGPSLRQFGGWGADPSPEVAAARALTEAFQARLAVIHGSRDSYNTVPEATRTHTRNARLQVLQAVDLHPLASIRCFESDDIAADTEFMLRGLASIGTAHAIVVDMTRPDLRLPVVRVRVPGLSMFVMDRQRPGWRSARYLL